MLSDRTLMRVSLAVTIAGIIGLFAVAGSLKPTAMAIADISDDDIGKYVVISGTIASYSSRDGNVFMNINNGTEIKAVMFEKQARNAPLAYRLKKGNAVRVIGRVQLYKGELEVVAEDVQLLGENSY